LKTSTGQNDELERLGRGRMRAAVSSSKSIRFNRRRLEAWKKSTLHRAIQVRLAPPRVKRRGGTRFEEIVDHSIGPSKPSTR